MDTTDELTTFLDVQREADGHEALSSAKMRSLWVAGRVVTISDEGRVVAAGVAATHAQADGSTHWSVETVVERSMRFPAFEDATLERVLQIVPRDAPMSVWSRRRSLDDALERAGFERVRSLAFMTVQLPLAEPTMLDVSSFADGDDGRLLAVNAATFGTHREAGGLDREELTGLMSQRWFDPLGVLFHEVEGSDAAFCWTKVHDNGDGEIYRIGVDPRFQGRGIGRGMVIAGFHHMAANHAVRRGVLWVDESNVAAVRLYERLGLETESRNGEFARTEQGGQPKR